ncbi:MAG TPA: hypothetical protein VG452_12195 [Egibacteraceae bacterium]|nr:hypothetical protein [Egibacteraceae bacterium]
MHTTTITDRSIPLAVRAEGRSDPVCPKPDSRWPRRAAALHAEEDGAQAVEYAMLGGVAAAVCGALILILRNPAVLRGIVEAVIAVLIRAVESWF